MWKGKHEGGIYMEDKEECNHSWILKKCSSTIHVHFCDFFEPKILTSAPVSPKHAVSESLQLSLDVANQVEYLPESHPGLAMAMMEIHYQTIPILLFPLPSPSNEILFRSPSPVKIRNTTPSPSARDSVKFLLPFFPHGLIIPVLTRRVLD